MKTKILISFFIFTFNFFLSSGQIPEGFNYQAIARDNGTLVTNFTLQVRVTIQSDSLGGTIFWQELHSGVKTNNYGLFGLSVGKGFRETGVPFFSDIDWSVSPKFIKTEINYNGWKAMGSSRLMTVPYAMVAKDINGTLKKLTVKGATANLEEALFEVKNNLGQTIFAVYNEGVRIYVEDGAKGSKGGFAVGGFDKAKVTNQEYLRVTRDSTRIYVKESVNKGSKGGFAVGGFDASKADLGNYLNLTSKNYFIGHNSGLSNTTGIYNSYIGFEAGMMNRTGSRNVFLGYNAGKMNDTASFNVFIGNSAGLSNMYGHYNVFIGYQSGLTSVTSGYNTFAGYMAGKNNTTGDGNLFLGFTSGFSNTWGYRNVFLGYNSGKFNVDGWENTFVGGHSGYGFNMGNANIMVGTYAGNYFYGGDNNIFIGNRSGYGVKNGLNLAYNNIFIGTSSGKNITTGTENTFIGSESGSLITNGINNVFIGPRSGYSNSSGYNNIFIGYLAGENASGNTNSTFIGNASGQNITGDDNILIGDRAGSNSYIASTQLMQTTVVGIDAGRNITGDNNTYFGYGAGSKWGSAGTGINNTFIGFQAGSGYTGAMLSDNNVSIGYQAGYGKNGSNKLYIANNSITTLIYGEFDTKKIGIDGFVGIGKTAPVTKLDITSGNWDIFNGEGDFRIGDGNYRFKIGVSNAGGGAGDVRMTAHGGTNRLILGGGGKDILLVTNANVMPWTDNYSTLGASLNRWSVVYAVNGTIQTSDARYKENINKLTYGLETILSLNPVTYSWKDDSDNRKHIGLIAQEVQKVIGEVIDEGTDPAKTLGINYSELIPVLIKGMQEQQRKIDELEALVKKLMSEK